MPQKQSGPPKPRRPWYRRYRTYTLLTSLVLSATLWFTFQHKPGWYHPVEVTEEIIQRARRHAPNLMDSISDHLVRHKSIEFTLQEREVNEWLAALPRAWPEARDALPRELSRLAVLFTDDGIRIGGHMNASGWQVILGISLEVTRDEASREIKVALTGVQGGSLPLPNLLIKPILNRALAKQSSANPAGDGEGDVVPLFQSADDLFNGIRFENRFEWPNGRRMFSIGRLSFGKGRVVIRLDPI